MAKALVLFSGGLDSLLAVKLMQEQAGLAVEGIHFTSLFTSKSGADGEAGAVRKTAAQFGFPLRVEENSEALLGLVKQPQYGLGRNMNPCIDCRIRNIRRAGEVMMEIGADFLVTGEVVGERPMSQNRNTMRQIEKVSGMRGLLLRPLSAKLLEPTVPEEKGWVDRETLLDIHGRSRKGQMALAAKYGMRNYPTPAGGCLLTDPGFSARLRDLLAHDAECDLNDCLLLKCGRHFRLGPDTRMVVGRNQAENELIIEAVREGDLLLEVATHPGPLALLRGRADDLMVALAGAITARYGKAMALPRVSVRIRRPGEMREAGKLFEVAPAQDECLAQFRIVYDETNKRRRG